MTSKNEYLEREANLFALCILIPHDNLIKDLSTVGDLYDDKCFTNLCKKYQITQGMMLARIKTIIINKD